MPTKNYLLNNLADTEALARQIASHLKGGEVLALSGNLGSGKTTFTQFLAKALGVKENVTSPTFVLMKKYLLNVKRYTLNALYHIDAYRLNDWTDAESLGLFDFLGQPETITVIEWADKIVDALPKNAIKIYFEASTNKRTVKIAQ